MISTILLHGNLGRWDEVIFLVLVGGFLLSLAWVIVGGRLRGRRHRR